MPNQMFNRPKVLISSLMMAEEPERFREELQDYDVDFLTSGQILTEQEILRYLKANGPIYGWISGDDEITDRILEEASPSLKVISKWGSGMDSIDLEGAKNRGIKVTNSPGTIAVSVAEVALGYGISLLRSLHFQDGQIRDGKWPKPVGWNIRGLQVGILGYGRIGRELHSMLNALGAKVFVQDPKFPELSVGHEKLLGEVRVLFICAPLNSSTEKFISREALLKMIRGSFIVNVSRGSIVDEQALFDAITSGHIGGAALDVLEHEPLAVDSPLLRTPNLIFGSHNANNTFAARESVNFEAIENLRMGDMPLE